MFSFLDTSQLLEPLKYNHFLLQLSFFQILALLSHTLQFYSLLPDAAALRVNSSRKAKVVCYDKVLPK